MLPIPRAASDNLLVDADNSDGRYYGPSGLGVNAQGDDGRGVTDSGKIKKTEQGN